MPALSLSQKTLDELQRRHLAFLEERLTSSEARAEWIRGFCAGYDRLLDQRVGDLARPEQLARSLQSVFTADSVRGFLAPIVRDLHQDLLDALKNDSTPMGHHV